MKCVSGDGWKQLAESVLCGCHSDWHWDPARLLVLKRNKLLQEFYARRKISHLSTSFIFLEEHVVATIPTQRQIEYAGS